MGTRMFYVCRLLVNSYCCSYLKVRCLTCSDVYLLTRNCSPWKVGNKLLSFILIHWSFCGTKWYIITSFKNVLFLDIISMIAGGILSNAPLEGRNRVLLSTKKYNNQWVKFSQKLKKSPFSNGGMRDVIPCKS